MEEDLQKLKGVLRSLVVSSPTQVDLRSLLRDYRSMMGEHIPIAKYGYRDLLTFLKERCSDCFLFGGVSSNPVLTLIVPDNLKHIDKFVRKQKAPTNVRVKGKRQSVPMNDLIVNTFIAKKETEMNPNTKPKAAATKNVENTVEKKMVELKLTDNTDSADSAPQHRVSTQDSSICSQDALRSFMRKRIPAYDCESSWGNESTGRTSSQDNDSGRQSSSSTSSSKLVKLENLKREIYDLVAEHPEGIWCTDLIGLYRDRYRKELNFTRYGYTSIISLVYALESIHASRPHDTGDWLLSLSAPAPAPPARAPAPAPPRARLPRRAHVDPEDALPGIEFDPDVFPSDCLQYMESVPPPGPCAEPGALLEVLVGEVYSPSHFWLIRLGDHYNIAMENIMDEMNAYYGAGGAGEARRLAVGAVRAGHYVAALYAAHWHRALIVQLLDADLVKVRHVDYGTVSRARVAELRPLRRAWGSLPAQAWRARLAGARPAARGRRWPRPAAAHFLNLVRDTPFVAHVVAVDHQENIMEVFLIDTSGEEDVCVTGELVKSGHAEPRADYALTVSVSPPRLDLRSLLGALSGLRPAGPGAERDACSDVSASASELVGRSPQRMQEWECPDAHSVLSDASSSRLARIKALHSRVKAVPVAPDVTNRFLRHKLALSKKLNS